MTPDEIARSFSGHDFAAAYEHLADDVRWTLVGDTVIEGREAVRSACEQTLAGLTDVTATFDRFVSTGDGDVVAVDAVGRYEGPDGVTAVSSCDVYEFRSGCVTAITSYTVEVEPPAGP